MRARAWGAWVLCAGLCVGCSDRQVSQPDAAPDRGIGREAGPIDGPPLKVDRGPPFVGNKEVDVLFVIDNSGSMGEEQRQLLLLGDFGRFIEALRDPRFGDDGTGKPCDATSRAGCAIPDLHLGVVSSDLGAGSYGLPSCERQGGDAGRLQSSPRQAGCQPPADRYVSYLSGQTNIPSAGQDTVQAVKDAFSCIAQLGTSGCGFEHTLESARRALQPGANPGFSRPGAVLALIFVTDEDDCSAQKPTLFDPSQQGLSDPLGPLTSFRCFEFGVRCDVNDRDQIGPRKGCVPALDWLYSVQSYVTFFEGLRAPGGVVVGAIAGPTDKVEVGKDGNTPVLRPSCISAAGMASPAIRIRAVVDAFAADGVFGSICDGAFGPPLSKVAERVLSKLSP